MRAPRVVIASIALLAVLAAAFAYLGERESDVTLVFHLEGSPADVVAILALHVELYRDGEEDMIVYFDHRYHGKKRGDFPWPLTLKDGRYRIKTVLTRNDWSINRAERAFVVGDDDRVRFSLPTAREESRK